MKRRYKILIMLTVLVVMVSLTTVPAFALTESEVQDQVNAVGKEAVTGNIFVWFLCAIAFLKVSQKIDSFMSSLGINVGHTGGSMLAEAMIAMRGAGIAKSFMGKGGGGGGGSGGSGGGNTFMKGGLSGVVSRKVTNNAVQNANGTKNGGLGGMAFNSSLGKGGGFANSIIGKIATGSIASTGSISGEGAADSLMSYMGYTALGPDAEDVPSFSNVDIGGGHIFATEMSDEHPEGIAMGMYHTDQYMAPEGEYTTVTTADGATWYKQYATDTVERTPYKAEDGSVAYNENIVKKLPRAPQRKDRV
ncbi:MAG: hypothetical protein IJY82_02000 [Oscillospiraceae bacterium]|nr:hypothetical protein [Oscillospiraceae bacterium]